MLSQQKLIFKLILSYKNLRELSEVSGIDKTRLHRLSKGKLELTLYEAIKLSKVTGFDFLSPSFTENHLSDIEGADLLSLI